MSVDIAQLGLSVRSDGVIVATNKLDALEKSAKRAETASERLSKQAEKMGRFLKFAAIAGGTAMAALAASSIKLAVAAEETANKFQVVFRGSVEKANNQLVELSKTIPITVTEMRALASGVQDMLVPMGLAREEAAGFSIEAVKLAGDIASFNNVGADQVLRNIGSALAGESEPLRKFGIDVRKSRLETIALANGLIKAGEELDNASTAQATFIAITQDSADAMGDAARTAGSTANQLKFMRRDINQAKEDLGQALIPALNDLLIALNTVGNDGFTPLQTSMRGIGKATLTVVSAFIIIKETALLVGEAIVGLAANITHSLMAIAAPFTEFVSTMGNAAALLTKGEFAAAADAFDGIGDRIVNGFEENSKAASVALGFIGDSLETRVGGALETVNALMTAFDGEVNRTLADTQKSMEKLTGVPLNEWLDEDAKALGKLLGVIDPTTKAVEEFATARALLNKALKAGEINLNEFNRLLDLLQRSAIAADAFGDSITKLSKLDPSIQKELDANFEYLDQLVEMEDAVRGLERQLDPLTGGMKDLADARQLLQDAFDAGLIDDDSFARLNQGIDRATGALQDMHNVFQNMLSDSIQALQEVTDLFADESKEAESLRTVMRLLNIVMGINAVIKQLNSGDPYSAIPRALSVAAMIASMGVQTGAAGSVASDRTLQESQGTGTVLGDTEAKTESILRASEITADATSELVGINRGMLHALQTLQTGLGGAVVQLARGSGDVDFGALPKVLDFKKILGGIPLIGDFLGGIFNKLFGGKSKLLDEGLQIMGGYLSDLTTEVMVQAWQQISVKKSIFHKTKIKDQFMDLGDEVGTQFALVFQSIYDTVEQAAIAIGVPLDVIEAKMASFELETMKISLMDLTAEEQREELLAVFGTIFDDLAVHVIPFIDDFQKVGEGLGETLVRVATSVQIMQEAVKALGFAADAIDPEAFAYMSVELVELVGGVENFIAGFTTFFDKFANDERKLAFATDQLTRAFEGVGLTIPDTRDGMFDLMMSLDATTEAGRAQIAMLLEIAGTADDYYSLLEKIQDDQLAGAKDLTEYINLQRRILAEFTGSSIYSGLLQLRDSFLEAMEAADALNATQREYGMIARSFNTQLRRMAAELTLSIISMTKQLFGQEMDGLADTIGSGLGEIREVANGVFDEWMRALEDLHDFTKSILLDEQLTTLTPAEQLAEADTQFSKLLAAARAGDVEAAAALPDAAKALLEEARFMFASGQQYTAIFDRVTNALNSINMPAGVTPTITVQPSVDDPITGPLAPSDPNTVLAEKLERFLLALDLGGTLRDLSQVLDTSVLGLIEELGIPLRELTEILGVELGGLSAATATQLADVAVVLGASVFDLAEALDINLQNLAAASGVHLGELSQAVVRELANFSVALGVSVLELTEKLGISIDDLAKTFGIGIDAFSGEQFKALVAFSESLGIGVTEVAEALDINLGEIADATSILSEAFGIAMAELPDAIQADLGPLLEAIRIATTEADANAALSDLGTYILNLPADLQTLLAPFLELFAIPDVSAELTALTGIEVNTALTVAAIQDLALAAAMAAEIPDEPFVLDPIVIDPIVIPPVIVPPIVVPPIVIDPIIIPPIPPIVIPPVVIPPVVVPFPMPFPMPFPVPFPVIVPMKQYATGGAVDKTGPAMLHAGEFVVTKTANNLNVAPNDGDGAPSESELMEIKTILSDIRDQNRRYQENDLALTSGMESSLKQQAEQTRRAANA